MGWAFRAAKSRQFVDAPRHETAWKPIKNIENDVNALCPSTIARNLWRKSHHKLRLLGRLAPPTAHLKEIALEVEDGLHSRKSKLEVAIDLHPGGRPICQQSFETIREFDEPVSVTSRRT